jgi:hypothetical protein
MVTFWIVINDNSHVEWKLFVHMFDCERVTKHQTPLVG